MQPQAREMSSPALPPRVLLFYKRLTSPGGAERQLLEEYRYLEQRGVDVRIATFQFEGDALFGERPRVELLRAGSSFRQILELRRLLRRLKPNLVSLHSGHVDLYLSTRGLNIPYVYHHNNPVLLHSDSPRESLQAWSIQKKLKALNKLPFAAHAPQELVRARRVRRFRAEVLAILDRAAARSAKLVVCLSEGTVKELALLYGVAAVSIPGGLSANLLSRSPSRARGSQDREYILSVSRLSAEKRLTLLIDAFELVADRHPELSLLIAGDGPERKALESRISASPMCDRITLLGFVPEAELWDLYAEARLFASPAWADFDLAPWEALALGTQVVWSSEMETDQQLIDSGWVVTALPTPSGFAEGFHAALHLTPRMEPPISHMTWEGKFGRIYSRLLSS